MYSFADGKCHSRKSSIFRRVRSAIFIPNEKSKCSFLPFEHSKLIFYVPEQVKHFLLFLLLQLNLFKKGLKTFADEEDENEELLERNFREERSELSELILQSQNGTSEEKNRSFDQLNSLNKKLKYFNEQVR